MRERQGLLPRHSTWADITAIPDLHGIRKEGNGCGSPQGETFAECMESPLSEGFAPVLAEACAGIGGLQIRNRGTIGGSLASAEPDADAVAALHTLGAEVLVASASGRRKLSLKAFAVGPRRTVLLPKRFSWACASPPGTTCGSVPCRLAARRAPSRAKLSVAVSAVAREGRASEAFGIAVGAAGPTVLRATRTEKALDARTGLRRSRDGHGGDSGGDPAPETSPPLPPRRWPAFSSRARAGRPRPHRGRNERSNDRTIERSNDRTIERSNDRTTSENRVPHRRMGPAGWRLAPSFRSRSFRSPDRSIVRSVRSPFIRSPDRFDHSIRRSPFIRSIVRSPDRSIPTRLPMLYEALLRPLLFALSSPIPKRSITGSRLGVLLAAALGWPGLLHAVYGFGDARLETSVAACASAQPGRPGRRLRQERPAPGSPSGQNEVMAALIEV